MCTFSGKESGRTVFGCESASTDTSWMFSWAKNALGERGGAERWKPVRVRMRRKLVVSGKTSFGR